MFHNNGDALQMPKHFRRNTELSKTSFAEWLASVPGLTTVGTTTGWGETNGSGLVEHHVLRNWLYAMEHPNVPTLQLGYDGYYMWSDDGRFDRSRIMEIPWAAAFYTELAIRYPVEYSTVLDDTYRPIHEVTRIPLVSAFACEVVLSSITISDIVYTTISTSKMGYWCPATGPIKMQNGSTSVVYQGEFVEVDALTHQPISRLPAHVITRVFGEEQK